MGKCFSDVGSAMGNSCAGKDILQLPAARVEPNDGRQVRAGDAVASVQGRAVPEAAKFGDGLREFAEAAEESSGMKAGSSGQFGGDVFVVGAMGGVCIQEAEGIAMGAKATDKSVYGIKFGVAEEASPQFKVGTVAARRKNCQARGKELESVPVIRDSLRY